MSSTPIVTISRFSRTFMRWNGIADAALNLTSSPAMPGIASRRAISSSIAVRRSGDRAVDAFARQCSSVPLMPRPQQKAASGLRSASGASSRQKR